MVTFLVFTILSALFGLAFYLTGAVAAAALWLFVKLPLGIVLLAIGVGLCCTLLLIPLGVPCLKSGVKLILPFV